MRAPERLPMYLPKPRGDGDGKGRVSCREAPVGGGVQPRARGHQEETIETVEHPSVARQ